MSIRIEVNSGPKHQILCYNYHSNGFLPEFLFKQQARHSFCSVLLTCLIILSTFFDFRKSKCGGNVIQPNKKNKP